MGGGCVINTPYLTEANVKASYPSGQTQWTCVIHNGHSTNSVVANAWAVCGTVS